MTMTPSPNADLNPFLDTVKHLPAIADGWVDAMPAGGDQSRDVVLRSGRGRRTQGGRRPCEVGY